MVAARGLGLATGGLTAVRLATLPPAAEPAEHVTQRTPLAARIIAAARLFAARGLAAGSLFAAGGLAARGLAAATLEQTAAALTTGRLATSVVATGIFATGRFAAAVAVMVQAEDAIQKLESLCVLDAAHKEQPCCHHGGQENAMNHGEGSFNT